MSLRFSFLTQHRRYFQNLVATFASQGTTALSLLLLTPLLVQRLGEAEFSTYGVLLNLVLIASIVDFGLNTGLCHRIIQEPEKRSALINAVFFYSPLVFLIALPVFWGLFAWGWVKVSSSYLFLALLLALLVAQNMLALLFEAILQSVNKIYLSKWIRVGRTLLEAGLLYVVSSSQQPEWLLLVTLLVNVAFVGTLYTVTRRELDLSISLAAFKIKELGSQLRYSFWYFQSMLASVIAYNVQILVLSHYLSVSQMTIFLLVFKFFEVIRTAMTNFTQVLFPAISMLQAEQHWSQLLQTFKKVLLRVIVFSLLVFAGMLLMGNNFFNWWSGYNTVESNTVFKVYALYVFLLVIDHVSVVFLLGLKFNRLPSIVSTAQSFLSLIATVYFIQWAGLPGAVWASLLLFATTSLIFNPLYVFYQLKQRVIAYA
jgi:O-antigen/teichoic acid export membrane protein